MVDKQSGGGGGSVQVYGVVIDKALNAKDVPLEQLKLLRDQAKATIEAQSDLVSSLARLEAEITRREK